MKMNLNLMYNILFFKNTGICEFWALTGEILVALDILSESMSDKTVMSR